MTPGKHLSDRDSVLQRIRHSLGLDRAIAFTVLARLCSILGSTGTVLLIVHFLTPIEQGYYYTLLSLVTLQTVFELGFSFVILQLAAHERSKLSLTPGRGFRGDEFAYARLAAVLRKSIRWYTVAAIVMAATLLPLGSYFFSTHRHAGAEVSWFAPWVFTVLVASFLFQIDPVFSFLEGCGLVMQVARIRFLQAIAGTTVAWAMIILHHGLFAPGAVIAAYATAGGTFLYHQRHLLLPLLRHAGAENTVSWRAEVWPFQWRIAVSWLCSYFVVQIFTPILFAYRGPIDAGRMGMSVSIAAYLGSLVLPWMTTKSAPFGNLISRGQTGELDRIFFRTLRQSTALLTAVVLLFMVALMVIQKLVPSLVVRMVSPPQFAMLLAGSVAAFVVQSEAIYLRAHKSEPFLWQSISVAVLTCIGAAALVPKWGTYGASITYFLCTGVLALVSATLIFQAKRQARARHSQPQSLELMAHAVE